MPYTLTKVGTGYKVQKKGSTKTYSKKAMPYTRAKAQLIALTIAETKPKTKVRK
jgi:hypothetical protein